MKIIDAHMHLWDLEHNYYPWLCDDPMVPFRHGDYGAIRRTYLCDDYRRDTAGHDVVGAVHVEAEWDPTDPVGETRWLTELQEKTGLPTGIVAQAWPARDDIDRVLAAQAQFPAVTGVRSRPRAAPSPEAVAPGAPGSLGDPAYRAGIARLRKYDLSFDLITPYWHLPEAAELARDFPDLQIIINHTGALADRVFETVEGFEEWRDAMRALAEQANVAVKISGLGVAGRPRSSDGYRAVVLTTIDLFGVDRCMFASNYPVDRLVGDFDTIYRGFEQVVASYPEPEIRKLFHDNAVRIYRLTS